MRLLRHLPTRAGGSFRAGRAAARTPAWHAAPGPDGSLLVLGMQWAPLMGSDPHALARRRARAARATHYVAAVSHAGTAGWVRLPRLLRQRTLYAAALAYARMHPRGPAAGVLTLPDGRAWVVAVQAGAVLPEGDRLCADGDEAAEHCAMLAGRHPGIVTAALELSALAGAVSDATRLLVLSGRLRSLPLPLRIMPLMLAVAYAFQHGPALWRDLGGGRRALPAVDPLPAWQQALQAAASSLVLHTGSDTAAVLYGLRRLPLGLRGWTLRRAMCEADGQGWGCSATYLRTSSAATNAGLAQALPSGWQLGFRPLDEAVLTWRVTGGGHRLKLAAIPEAARTDTDYASRLQSMRAAFLQVGLGSPIPLAVSAPRDERGLQLAQPAGLPRLQRRPIAVQGPLRSLALLARRPPPGAWQQLILEVLPQQPAGLDSSRLLARLQGVLYEKR